MPKNKIAQLPKMLKIEAVRSLLGDAAADRLLSAVMRARAGKIRPVTVEEIQNARAYLETDHPDHFQRAAVRAVAVKWVLEQPKLRNAYARYLDKLLEQTQPRTPSKKGKRYAKAAK